MKYCALFFLTLCFCAHRLHGAPMPILPNPGLNPTLIDPVATLQAILDGIIKGNIENLETLGEVISALLQAVSYIIPPPSSIPQALEAVKRAAASDPSGKPPNLIEYALKLVLEGINPANVQLNLAALTVFNSMNNVNPPLANVIKSGDPPYSVPESVLRSAMYFPVEFKALNASKLRPIVMIPPTAIPSGQSWGSNYAKLLRENGIANPMFVNIPSNSLQDAQITAEYVAYAINYVSQYTGGGNISVMAWSQGTINTQWALKYFPSTREVVSDYIAIAPVYNGTVLAQVVCPGFPRLPCAPSFLQQIDGSTFINTLRRNGGDSTFVPTTTIYSALDQVVQPQSGPNASGYLRGASNNLVQELCPLQPAGLLYTHEGILYNPLGYALAVDALTHDGHADVIRTFVNNPDICLFPVTPGLNLIDVLVVESTIVTAVLNTLLYFPKVFEEPPIRSYATY